jgi:hypothetical protein
VSFIQTQSCYRGPLTELTNLHSFLGLSIYGGNDVQLPSAVVITVSLESGKALADLVPTGHGNLHTLPFESRLDKSW